MVTQRLDNLRPCPFCGKSELHTNRYGHVRCVNDECYQNQFIAEYAWQTRPIEDALQKRVEELEKLSDAHKKLACLVDKQHQETLASIRKAVEDARLWLRRYQQGKENEIALGMDIALDILRKHGLLEDK